MITNSSNGFQSDKYHPARTVKADKDFAKHFDFSDIKFTVKVRDIHKIEKNNSIGICVFGYENIQFVYLKKML